jgi:hypothetical protein
MTGTPVENRLSDLWSLFDFLNPGLLGTAKQFKRVRQAAQRAGRTLVRAAAAAGAALHPAAAEDRQAHHRRPARQDRGEGLLRPEQAAGRPLPAGGRDLARLRKRRRHPAARHRAGLPDAAQADLQPPRPLGSATNAFRPPRAASSSAGEICEEIASAAGEGAGLHAVPRDDRAAGRLPRRLFGAAGPGAARRHGREAAARSWSISSSATTARRSSCCR